MTLDSSVSNQKIKSTLEKVLELLKKYWKYCLGLFAIVGVVGTVVSIYADTSDNYKGWILDKNNSIYDFQNFIYKYRLYTCVCPYGTPLTVTQGCERQDQRNCRDCHDGYTEVINTMIGTTSCSLPKTEITEVINTTFLIAARNGDIADLEKIQSVFLENRVFYQLCLCWC